MKLKGKIIIGAMVLTAISGMQSMAQNVYELTPVLVTANRYSTPDLKIPAATEVFTQEKIKQLGAQTVMDVVKNIPGFSFTASPTGNQYVGFRGLGRNYTAILVNGIPLGQDANYDLDAISTDTIERIEVVKGVLRCSMALVQWLVLLISLQKKKVAHLKSLSVVGISIN